MSTLRPTSARVEIHAGKVGRFGTETVVLANGHVAHLDILRHPGAAAVVPVHDDGSITLIRQYRHAGGGVLWEIPAGKLDPGEDPATAANREMAEEVGLTGDLTLLCSILTTPAFTDEVIHIYVAQNLQPATLSLDPGEEIEAQRLSPPQIHALIASGAISDAKTLIGLMRVLYRPVTT